MYSFPIKSKAGLAAMAHVVLSLTTVGELHHLPPIQGDDHALDFTGAFLTVQEEWHVTKLYAWILPRFF